MRSIASEIARNGRLRRAAGQNTFVKKSDRRASFRAENTRFKSAKTSLGRLAATQAFRQRAGQMVGRRNLEAKTRETISFAR
jgi:hypothetical protein